MKLSHFLAGSFLGVVLLGLALNIFPEEQDTSLFSSAYAGFGVNSEDLFAHYTSWPSSTTLDSNDTVIQSLYYLYTSSSYSSLADMNGDGLMDIIIHHSAGPRKYAILINNGNIGFDLAYKCYRLNSSPYTWYGDCAQ